MQSDNSIISTIFKGLDFTESEIEIITNVFHKIKVKKGTILLEPKAIVDVQYYILDGCLRAYHTDGHSKEHTVMFGIKDWWISDFTALFSGDNSIMTIEVLQDATLYKITKTDRDYIYNRIPRIDRFFRLKLEKAFASFQKRILESLSQTAKQRYINFVKSYPHIEQNVKNYHIASYLGITTESLSRIRKELAKN